MLENELCSNFMAAATSYGWDCYPETDDWDILLVREGTQLGLQAKTTLSLRVLEQCLALGARNSYRRGPHFRGILVPDAKARSSTVLKRLQLFCFGDRRYNHVVLQDAFRINADPMMNWRPLTTCWLPAVIPKVPAGVPAPLRLTQWKQSALRLLARAAHRGFVTCDDLRELRLSPTIFHNRGWLVPDGNKTGRKPHYVLATTPQHIRPDQQHPEEYAFFLAEERNRAAAT